MNIEDKKFLAEWMGERFIQVNLREVTLLEHRTDFILWRPDTDHYQFSEIWTKMVVGEKLAVLGILHTTELGYIEFFLWRLPEVMQAVLEVLKVKE